MEAHEVPRPPPRLQQPHCPSPPPSSRSRPPPASEAIVIVALYGEPRGMTGTGSGDAARELLAFDEAGGAAPSDIRNVPQECLGASVGVNLGAPARERKAAAPRVARGNPGVAWTRGRAYVMLNPASDDVICGLTCNGCWDGAREDVIASVIGQLMGRVW